MLARRRGSGKIVRTRQEYRGEVMAASVERRQGNRRKAPIRTGKDRRDPAIPSRPGSTRSGKERRQRDRRKGDRRSAR